MMNNFNINQQSVDISKASIGFLVYCMREQAGCSRDYFAPLLGMTPNALQLKECGYNNFSFTQLEQATALCDASLQRVFDHAKQLDSFPIDLTQNHRRSSFFNPFFDAPVKERIDIQRPLLEKPVLSELAQFFRKKKRISKFDAAPIWGISKSTVYSFERGESCCGLRQAWGIATMAGLTLDQFATAARMVQDNPSLRRNMAPQL